MAVQFLARHWDEVVVVQTRLKLPTHATAVTFSCYSPRCRHHTLIIIPDIETNMHLCSQVIKCWIAALAIGLKRRMLTVQVVFRVSRIPYTKTIIFFLLVCTNMPRIWCTVCACVNKNVCVWLMYYAAHYSNYTVCLSHSIAVPVFVVPQLPERARNAIMPSLSSNGKRYTPSQSKHVCVFVRLDLLFLNRQMCVPDVF